jgi:UDP-sulfoquinovose synthase
MRVIVLGVDGYLGRATAMHLARDHEVWGVDNYYKRTILTNYNIKPLVETSLMGIFASDYHRQSGKAIRYYHMDMTNEEDVKRLIKTVQPDAIIHYAEQPSAPYSMRGEEEGMETVINNLSTTLRLVYGIARFKPDVHLIKLGSMGTYGTPDTPIPEGWFTCDYRGRQDRMLFPRKPHSIYHLSKTHDSDLIAFACRVWGLRATDLHQGIVYGISTEETTHDSLYPRFCYDDMFGTALNRFVTQAVAGVPLTVYGSGGQTRGWLNIRDTLQCVKLALESPSEAGEYRIFNQFTEQFSVQQIAEKVRSAAKDLRIHVNINHIDNPRTEQESHFYEADHTGLLDLGLQPHYLDEVVIQEMLVYVKKYKDNINRDQIMPKVTWKEGAVC